MFVIVLIVSNPLQAQPQTAPSLTGDTTLATELATITTDTGDFAPGHHDFTRYTTPALCLGAVMNVEQIHQNSLAALYEELDSGNRGDTLPTLAMQIIRRCGADLTVANTVPGEWWALFDLAVLAGRDSLAQQVLARRVATAGSSAIRSALEREALMVYLSGDERRTGISSPRLARVPLAKALVAQWDTQPDRTLRYDGHVRLSEHDDDMNTVIAQIDTMGRQVDAPVLRQVSANLLSAYQKRVRHALDESPDSIAAVARRAQRDLQSFSSDSICVYWFPRCRTSSVAQVDSFLQATWEPGLPVPRLQHVVWFPHQGAPGDTIFPVPGKITLIVKPPAVCQVDADWLLYQAVCAQAAAVMRHVLHRYNANDIAVVLVADERGHAFLSGVETAEQEAERIRWFFQDLQGLPVTVAVQGPTPWQTLPAPDNRRFRSYSFYQWTQNRFTDFDYLLIARDGRENRKSGEPGFAINWKSWLDFKALDSDIDRLEKTRPSFLGMQPRTSAVP